MKAVPNKEANQGWKTKKKKLALEILSKYDKMTTHGL